MSAVVTRGLELRSRLPTERPADPWLGGAGGAGGEGPSATAPPARKLQTSAAAAGPALWAGATLGMRGANELNGLVVQNGCGT